MIGLLLLGFWKLQVIDSDKYGLMAEQNRVRSIPIIAPRGRMLDRDGRVLVDNRPSFSVRFSAMIRNSSNNICPPFPMDLVFPLMICTTNYGTPAICLNFSPSSLSR